jgi:hypothetical protein
VTDCAALIETEQMPVPEQAPLHPVKVDPAEGAAVRLTFWPCAKFPVQVAVQFTPLGVLTTVPLPLPLIVRLSGKVGWVLNVAVTDRAALMVTVQGSALQSPLHPANTEPTSDETADSVTGVPSVNDVEHVLPQVMPAGLLVTVPDPVPIFMTERAYVGINVNVALTDFELSMMTGHVPVPLHGLPHPVNVDPLFGVALIVMVVPYEIVGDAVQVLPVHVNVRPGAEMLPDPVPFLITVSV